MLHEEGMQSIPSYITGIVKQCQAFFVENERTARRFLKILAKEIIIDNYEWFKMDINEGATDSFRKKIKEEKVIGIISEAGCPGIADPGQQLVAIAHEMNVEVKPLVGPNSILLALMASGMNGQQFRFAGYLPIREHERNKSIKDLETDSVKNNSTQIFIETPYRNNQMIEALCKNCNPATKLCVAVDLTGQNEWIKTKTIAEWQKNKPDIHKRPAIFLLYREK
ncbi:MAG TPA: SAM-dependent methyltransferase [Chitinophagaceae bacterium]|nr:SAM-dependent methyltransferase [Chitinophagaceae bacterium]